jgi:RimJ/RimL family protein N-acetyltransferase
VGIDQCPLARLLALTMHDLESTINEEGTTVLRQRGEKSLTLDAFVDLVIAEMALEADSAITANTHLIDELAFDSLRYLELTALLAELVGPDKSIDVSVIDFMDTLASAFEYYQIALEAQPVYKDLDAKETGDSKPVDADGGQSRSQSDLVGNLVNLRACKQTDMQALYEMVLNDEVARRWRYNGAQPSYETFASTFTNGVLTQYTVGLNSIASVAGLVTAYNPDLRNRFCYVSAYCDATLIGTGVGFEAIVLFISHIFQTWDFVKIYAEVAEYNYDSWSSGEGSVFQVEGRLKNHLYQADRRWDQLVLAVYPDQARSAVAQLRGSGARTTSVA